MDLTGDHAMDRREFQVMGQVKSIFGIAFLLLGSASAFAASGQEKAREEINDNIGKIRTNIQNISKNLETLEENIKTAEKNIGLLEQEIAAKKKAKEEVAAN